MSACFGSDLSDTLYLWHGVVNEQRAADARNKHMPALPAIGKLPCLRQLWTSAFSALDAQRGLQFLTGLTRLTKLVGFEKAGAAAVGDFWATVKAQRSS